MVVAVRGVPERRGRLPRFRAQRIQAGESPEVVIKALGFNRSVVYSWLKRFERDIMVT